MLQNPRLLLAASISIAVHGAFAAALLTQQEEAQLLESSSPFEMVVLAEQRVDLAMPSEG
ncbi:MAG: hypothetical protein HOA22_10085, partial [Gammaproteobacteria bacterium]|nr:hypothetical protein [Gammaproteobacteria bacterium]